MPEDRSDRAGPARRAGAVAWLAVAAGALAWLAVTSPSGTASSAVEVRILDRTAPALPLLGAPPGWS